MSILAKIVFEKKKELLLQKVKVPVIQLEKTHKYNREPISLNKRFSSVPFGIIAEFKRRSPSIPSINLNAITEDIVPEYEKSGAIATSILTEQTFFGGSLNDLQTVRDSVSIPILRKDFVVDSYQIKEAKSAGADVILLIGAILSKREVRDLTREAMDLGMEVLYEVREERELDSWFPDIHLLGVNNRNLKTFEVSIQHGIKLSNSLPKECTWIAESGIKNADDVYLMTQAGFKGFLIGETFMRTENPGEACQKLIREVNGKFQGYLL